MPHTQCGVRPHLATRAAAETQDSPVARREMTMLAYLLVLFAVVFRLVTEASALNFAPVAAALLFFGSRMPRRQAWVPVAADRQRCGVDHPRLRLSAARRPDRDLGLVPGHRSAGQPAGWPRQEQRLAHRRSIARGIAFVFPAEQLRGVGRLGDVSSDLPGPAGLLHRGAAVLPQYGRLRHALHGGVLRHSGGGRDAQEQNSRKTLSV